MAQVPPWIVLLSLILNISAAPPYMAQFPFFWNQPQYAHPPNRYQNVPQIFREDFQNTRQDSSGRAVPRKPELWPNAAIIYKLDNNIGCPFSYKCQILMIAMSIYEKDNSCIRFKPWTGEDDFVFIVVDPDPYTCKSARGRLGGQQQIYLGETCWHIGSIVHELGHTLGLLDEIQHPDRDNHIIVLDYNIIPSMRGVFNKADEPDLLDEPFDLTSIMMYDRLAFSKDGTSATLASKYNEPMPPPIWERENLSSFDVRKINKLYQCLPSGQQKPEFPTDVYCSFNQHTCGFRSSWEWLWSPLRTFHFPPYQGTEFGGELYTDFRRAGYNIGRVWSINFHGLSPIDEKRGPMGCVSFSYSLSANGQAYIQLYQTILDSPQQLFYDPGKSTELWSIRAPSSGDWFKVLLPLRVTAPFVVRITYNIKYASMDWNNSSVRFLGVSLAQPPRRGADADKRLVFQSAFGARTTNGIIKLNNFELSYTPCDSKKSTAFTRPQPAPPAYWPQPQPLPPQRPHAPLPFASFCSLLRPLETMASLFRRH